MIVVSDITVRAFDSCGTTRAVALDICKAFDRVWHAGVIHKLKTQEFQAVCLALLHLFSVKDIFECFWMENLCKNIQLMLEFFKAPFLVLHLCYYISMTFLMMLCVILPFMLIILL